MSIQPVESKRHRVVVIGSGFGGLFGVKALKKADVDITLVAKTTHHLFQPLLYQVATGILSVGEIAPTTRVILRKQKNAEVLLGDVLNIDLEAKTVTSKLLERVTVTPFDSLIVAAGAQQSYFGNDHFAEFAPGMKTIDDALELRGRILGAFEQAELSDDQEEKDRLMTFVVVGAGPTASNSQDRSQNSPTAPSTERSATSTPATRASSCWTPHRPSFPRWARSSVARQPNGSRSSASRSSSTRWSPTSTTTA
jgi:NADH dehydrogenase